MDATDACSHDQYLKEDKLNLLCVMLDDKYSPRLFFRMTGCSLAKYQPPGPVNGGDVLHIYRRANVVQTNCRFPDNFRKCSKDLIQCHSGPLSTVG